MARKKRGDVYNKSLDLIIRAGASGLKQKELESMLGISKSYCSEIISRMVSEGLVKRVTIKGVGATVYLKDLYPGRLAGILRTGLLKSSEYVPAMSFLMQYASTIGVDISFRFYDSTVKLLEDLRLAALEIALAPTNSLILSALLGMDIRICSGLSSGGSGIIFEKNWEKDALLSTEVSSMITMSLRANSEIVPSKIESFSDPGTGSSRFKTEKYRAIAIWEPYFSLLKGEISPEVVIDYSDALDGFPCCSLATTREFWAENWKLFHDDIPKFMTDDITGLEERDYVKKAIGILSDNLGIRPDIISGSLDSYNFSNKKINRDHLTKMGISLSKRQEDQIFDSGLLI